MNLIVNAKDAMPNGGEIIIETAKVQLDRHYIARHKEAKAGSYVLLAISDTGEGMDDEVLSKIFDPFFTTKERGKGTGLGLATVYGIVKQHEGFIYAYSEKGRGTTFKIYLPASEKNAENCEEKHIDKEMLQGSETILIVDDNQYICHLVIETLQPLGYTCLHATSGEDALNLLRDYNGEVHLLLTDVVMPGMNGFQATRQISKNTETSSIPVIMVTTKDQETDKVWAMRQGAKDYIVKPVQEKALIEHVNMVLSA